MMLSCYADYATRSTADLTRVLRVANVWEINRIKVNAAHYGKGVGRELLRRVIADAEREKAVLRLTINPYGPLSYEALKAWYERNGFVQHGNGYFVRVPSTLDDSFESHGYDYAVPMWRKR